MSPLPVLRSVPTEAWAALTALAGATAILAKKLIAPRRPPKADPVTRAEFHAAIDATRDRIGASYLALAEIIEQQHNQVLTTLERQGANFEHRIDNLEANLARLDERTALFHQSINPLIH